MSNFDGIFFSGHPTSVNSFSFCIFSSFSVSFTSLDSISVDIDKIDIGCVNSCNLCILSSLIF